jgi:very-short-patch-repair endonuclease
LDGTIHNYRLKNDKERTKILNSLGLNVVRFRNDEIESNLALVLEKLRKYINSSPAVEI